MGVRARMVRGSYRSSYAVILTLLIEHACSLKLEENPIEVLEKLIEHHKSSTAGSLDSASSSSDHQYTKLIYQADQSLDDELSSKPTTRIRHPTQNEKNKLIVLAGKLRNPNKSSGDGEDEANTRSEKYGKTNKSSEKTCNVCHDRNDWIPIGKETQDESDKAAGSSETKIHSGQIKSRKNNDEKKDEKDLKLDRKPKLKKIETKKLIQAEES